MARYENGIYYNDDGSTFDPSSLFGSGYQSTGLNTQFYANPTQAPALPPPQMAAQQGLASLDPNLLNAVGQYTGASQTAQSYGLQSLANQYSQADIIRAIQQQTGDTGFDANDFSYLLGFSNQPTAAPTAAPVMVPATAAPTTAPAPVATPDPVAAPAPVATSVPVAAPAPKAVEDVDISKFLIDLRNNPALTQAQRNEEIRKAALANNVDAARLAPYLGSTEDLTSAFLSGSRPAPTDGPQYDLANFENYRKQQELIKQGNIGLGASYDDPFATNEARAQAQALLDQANALTVDRSKVQADLRRAIANGEDLNQYYGDTDNDALSLLKDLGVDRGSKGAQGIIDASPTGAAGAWKFDPVFGSDYYKQFAEAVGSRLGVSGESVRKIAGQYANDTMYNQQGKGFDGGIGDPAFLTGMTKQLIAATGQDPSDPKFAETLNQARGYAKEVSDALYSESDSSGFFKQAAQRFGRNPLLPVVTAGLGSLVAAPLAATASAATGLAIPTSVALGTLTGAGTGLVKGVGEGTFKDIVTDTLKGGAKGAATAYVGEGLSGLASQASDLVGGGFTGDVVKGAVQGAGKGGIGSLLNGGDFVEGVVNGGLSGGFSGGVKYGIDSLLEPDQELPGFVDEYTGRNIPLSDDFLANLPPLDAVATVYPFDSPTTGPAIPLEPNVFDQDNAGVPTGPGVRSDGPPPSIEIPSAPEPVFNPVKDLPPSVLGVGTGTGTGSGTARPQTGTGAGTGTGVGTGTGTGSGSSVVPTGLTIAGLIALLDQLNKADAPSGYTSPISSGPATPYQAPEFYAPPSQGLMQYNLNPTSNARGLSSLSLMPGGGSTPSYFKV